MPTTPVLALPYPAATDTADVPRDIQALAVKLDGYTSLRPPVVTSLPGSPADGQECYYRFVPTTTPASTVPLVWHLRYDAAISAWLPVGSQRPILVIYDTGAATSAGTGTWGSYDANDPRLTIPLAGTYEIESGIAEGYGGTLTAIAQSPFKNGAQIPQVESIAPTSATIGGNQQVRTSQVLAAADVLRQTYLFFATGAQSVTLRGRYAQATPVRIG